MAFYDLTKPQREKVVDGINRQLLAGIKSKDLSQIRCYFNDEDTYIRKSAYQSLGKIYFAHKALQSTIISTLELLCKEDDYKTRQTVINAAGEIGKSDFETVQPFFDKGLLDEHFSPRNAVIGSIKKMGEAIYPSR